MSEEPPATPERIPEKIQAILQSLPHKPGVYLHKDAQGHILYVGKATSLYQRVRSYFGDPADLSPKNRALVAHIADIEFIVVGSEVGVDPRKRVHQTVPAEI